jgi:hypothetical protein
MSLRLGTFFIRAATVAGAGNSIFPVPPKNFTRSLGMSTITSSWGSILSFSHRSGHPASPAAFERKLAAAAWLGERKLASLVRIAFSRSTGPPTLTTLRSCQTSQIGSGGDYGRSAPQIAKTWPWGPDRGDASNRPPHSPRAMASMTWCSGSDFIAFCTAAGLNICKGYNDRPRGLSRVPPIG